jgi:hypothetical protein
MRDATTDASVTKRPWASSAGRLSPASSDPSVGDITLCAPWGNLAIFIEDFSATRGLVRLGAFDGPINAPTKGGPVPVRFEVAD